MINYRQKIQGGNENIIYIYIITIIWLAEQDGRKA